MSKAEGTVPEGHSASERYEDRRGEILLARLENKRQRRKDLQEKLNLLTTRMWTDPGPRHENEARTILEDLEEIDREEEELLEKFDAYLDSLKGSAVALQDSMRVALERQYELEKHVTTLSTASILGVAALTKLFPESPDLGPAVAQSLIWFLVAIVTAIFAMFGDNVEHIGVGARRIQERRKIERIALRVVDRLVWVSRLACLIAFCWGLTVIIAFVIRAS